VLATYARCATASKGPLPAVGYATATYARCAEAREEKGEEKGAKVVPALALPLQGSPCVLRLLLGFMPCGRTVTPCDSASIANSTSRVRASLCLCVAYPKANDAPPFASPVALCAFALLVPLCP
jgi:hypothetical protein